MKTTIPPRDEVIRLAARFCLTTPPKPEDPPETPRYVRETKDARDITKDVARELNRLGRATRDSLCKRLNSGKTQVNEALRRMFIDGHALYELKEVPKGGGRPRVWWLTPKGKELL
jgi:hypothetical protein